MIEFLICGINENKVVPIKLFSDNGISVTNSNSNNKSPGKAETNGLLLGKHKNQFLPIAVDETGRIIV